MPKFKGGDKVRIVQIDKNYGNPYVGKTGYIQSIYIGGNESLNNYQVEVMKGRDVTSDSEILATLTLFSKELELVTGD